MHVWKRVIRAKRYTVGSKYREKRRYNIGFMTDPGFAHLQLLWLLPMQDILRRTRI